MDRGFVFNYTDIEWKAGKEQARRILRRVAARNELLSYTDLSNELTEISVSAHDPAMSALLGQISEEEFALGNGMLSVVVVHKNGDKQPGPGFYECAEKLGLTVGDKMKFWIDQLLFVYRKHE